MVNQDMVSEEEKEMARYVIEVHNLANKGIKGRGKGCKVKRVTLLHPPQQHSLPASSPISITTASNTSTIHSAAPYPMSPLPHGLPNMHTPPQHLPMAMEHDHQAIYGLNNLATYSIAGPPPHTVFGGPVAISTHGVLYAPYSILDSEQLRYASSVDGSTLVMDLPFGDRMH
ncbi:hypothetical protein MYCTH_2310780 [Thermothelomyces thermophilus ATCC 42464]|uniref:Uncharacterized protein n=1 Tax=Thermothelomyces thermophilus (strain ATCC 42464 / BCRC 31852 / DSM 1799) TaxID=573729 RepID=G2QM25_THET4|nr:uncharacterized protein MYCTH_2310780 [Thermothelomyces thermophilus ATCC 42464]AEO61005.1 hypothetical protein MYCTH_2310780 [Thermothelomyces thermophilus ATCC 42464]